MLKSECAIVLSWSVSGEVQECLPRARLVICLEAVASEVKLTNCLNCVANRCIIEVWVFTNFLCPKPVGIRLEDVLRMRLEANGVAVKCDGVDLRVVI